MTESTEQPSSPVPYSQQAEVISSRKRVEGILHTIVRQRLFVTVRLPGRQEEFNSTVLELEESGDVFLLDELYPEVGHRQLQQLRELRVHTRLRGAEIDFHSTVRDVGEEDGIAFYRVRLPEQVRYFQRRRARRVTTDQLETVLLRIVPAGSDPDHAVRLHDLSEAGAGLWVDPATEEWLKPGMEFPGCELVLHDGEVLLLDVKVRNLRYDHRHRGYVAGASFSYSDPRSQRRMARFVTTVERQLLRARSRTE